MKYNMLCVTFWFNEVENIIDYYDILSNELKDDFLSFNLIGVPPEFDPVVPRITSSSKNGICNLNMSKINLQVTINKDGINKDNFSDFYNYIKDESFRIFDMLSTKCDLKVLYSAMYVNCDCEYDDPTEKIINSIFNKKFKSGELCEVGVKYSEIVDNKYYNNTIVNDAKVVSYNKKIDQGTKNQNIIFALIPEIDVNIEKKVISYTGEITDKYSFNTIEGYSTTKENMEEIFSLCNNKMLNFFGDFEN